MKCILLFATLEIFITVTMQEKNSSKHDFNTFFPKVVLFGDSLTQVRIEWFFNSLTILCTNALSASFDNFILEYPISIVKY